MQGHQWKLKGEWEITQGGESAEEYLINAVSVTGIATACCLYRDTKLKTARWGQGQR